MSRRPALHHGSSISVPPGVSIHGFVDVLRKLNLVISSVEARQLNTMIFKMVYFFTLTHSCKLAQNLNSSQAYFRSPAAFRVFQHDLWKASPSQMWDWTSLLQMIQENGLRYLNLVTCSIDIWYGRVNNVNAGVEPYLRCILTLDCTLLTHLSITFVVNVPSGEWIQEIGFKCSVHTWWMLWMLSTFRMMRRDHWSWQMEVWHYFNGPV